MIGLDVHVTCMIHPHVYILSGHLSNIHSMLLVDFINIQTPHHQCKKDTTTKETLDDIFSFILGQLKYPWILKEQLAN